MLKRLRLFFCRMGFHSSTLYLTVKGHSGNGIAWNEGWWACSICDEKLAHFQPDAPHWNRCPTCGR